MEGGGLILVPPSGDDPLGTFTLTMDGVVAPRSRIGAKCAASFCDAGRCGSLSSSGDELTFRLERGPLLPFAKLGRTNRH